MRIEGKRRTLSKGTSSIKKGGRLMRYQTKPMVVEAFRYGHDIWPEWFKQAKEEGKIRVVHAEDEYSLDGCVIAGEQPMFCPDGDYIVCDEGVLSHHAKEDFERKHDVVEDHAVPPQDDISIEVPTILQPVFGKKLRAMKHIVDRQIVVTFSTGFNGFTDCIESIEDRAQDESFFTVVNEEVRKLFDKESRIDL